MHIYIYIYIYGIRKDGPDEPTFRATVETQAQRTDLWTWWEGRKSGVGQTERVA